MALAMIPISAVAKFGVVLLFVACASSSDIERMNQGAQCFFAHNFLRELNGAPPLEWDEQLAKESTDYAVKMVEDNAMKHSTGPYGENLFIGWGGTPICAKLVYGWYDEYQQHNFSSNTFIYASSHFTQVVWNATTKVGMGVAHSKSLNRWAACARYTPTGNIQGAFLDNVFPMKNGASLPTADEVQALAANVTAFVLPANSGHALTFWQSSVQVFVLMAASFLACIFGVNGFDN